MQQRSKISPKFLAAVTLLIQLPSSHASEAPSAPDTEWENWISAPSSQTEDIAVQNRAIAKSGRLQIVGPLLGMSDRKDFYTTYALAAGIRYHFSESHAWELFRFSFTMANETDLVTQIKEQTNFKPDVQLSRFQIGSSYVYTPIYGKYSWGSDHLIHFDIFGSIGGGLRFANDLQPFGELGLGMNHYLFSNRFSVVPEFRERIYSEKRTNSVLVFESIFQVGVAWLL